MSQGISVYIELIIPMSVRDNKTRIRSNQKDRFKSYRIFLIRPFVEDLLVMVYHTLHTLQLRVEPLTELNQRFVTVLCHFLRVNQY